MMSTGTFYGQKAIMEAVFIRFNSGTAYGHKMIGNNLPACWPLGNPASNRIAGGGHFAHEA